MKAIVLPAFATALLLSATSVAGTEREPKEQQADPEAVTCKQVQLVNSRIPTRICRTNLEWEAERRAQLEERRSSRRPASSCSGAGPC